MKRRSVLRAGAMALLPLIAVRTAEQQAGAAEQPRGLPGFSPPNAPMRLSRTVRRELPGGHAIVVRRDYAIRIVPTDTGFSVEGSLLECSVDAPPPLRAMAEIEQRRADVGLFPIALNTNGIIQAKAVSAPGPAYVAATGVARTILSRGLSDPGARQAAEGFVARLGSGASGGEWPADLFRPVSGQRSENLQVPLGDGQQGQVTIIIDAEHDSVSALLSRFRRIVVTQLGGSQRITKEEWTLVPG